MKVKVEVGMNPGIVLPLWHQWGQSIFVSLNMADLGVHNWQGDAAASERLDLILSFTQALTGALAAPMLCNHHGPSTGFETAAQWLRHQSNPQEFVETWEMFSHETYPSTQSRMSKYLLRWRSTEDLNSLFPSKTIPNFQSGIFILPQKF